jgi:hypothetical protein
MRKAFDGIKKIPHPEEAAKQLSRRTHGVIQPIVNFLTASGSRGPLFRGTNLSSIGKALRLLSKLEVVEGWIPAFRREDEGGRRSIE